MSIGRPLPHDAARLHVTGAARYIDDIPSPQNTLHLAFGLADIAHGRLRSVDLAAVRAAPGVIAAFGAADLEHNPDCSPSVHDEPLLAQDHIMYHGQPVFLAIATSQMAARRAARLGRIEAEPLPPILTIEDAIAADSRFEDAPRIYANGDAPAVIARAPHRLSGRLNVGGQEHFYLEGQVALAIPMEGGDMLVHSSTQHPTEIQHKVAEALGLPMHSVRVETRRMGGGFGGKESQGNALAVACALAARATGRPCKMRYDRDDDMMITGKRHDFRIDYDVGFDDHGRVLGVDFRQYARCGWAQDLSIPVADRAMLHADNAYHLPAARIESHRLRTHTQSATAFRGFGGPQGMIGIERVMDHIAHHLGLDGAEIRRRNYYAEMAEATLVAGAASQGDLTSRGAVATDTPAPVQITPYHMEVEDFILHGITAQLLEGADYAARRAAVAEYNAQSPILRRGIAFSPVKFGISFTLTHLNQAGALVHVYQDGSVQINHGGTEMGQGLFQKVAQVAASAFGISLDHIKITATDTAKVPNTSATAASSGSDLNGMAVKAACDTIRTRIGEFLAGHYGTRDIRFHDNMVTVGTHAMPFVAAVRLAYENRISLSSTGFYKTPKVNWDRLAGRGRPFFYFAYGAAITEVVIDTLTGENRILRTDIVHDVGASLNPAIDIGQIEGGYVQGAGWLTTEELVWDDAGRLRTHAPSTYKIPASSDRPPVFNVTLWDGVNREDTIYRSKAVGEPPLMLAISAWLALGDAVASCGPNYPDLQTPATPEQILAAIERTRA